MSDNRKTYKYLALLQRGGAGVARCDMCHTAMATDYHELIPRSMTRGNTRAEELSYAPTLCACLCNRCHIGHKTNAHSPKVREQLFRRNYELWGESRVRLDFEKVNQCLKVKLPFQLP